MTDQPDKPSVREALEVLLSYVSNSECCPEAPLPSREAAGAALAAFDGWDEPITEEWLHDHGECCTTAPPKFAFPIECGTVYVSNCRRLWSVTNSSLWQVDACGGELDLRIKTRLDLLLLLAALNGEAGG